VPRGQASIVRNQPFAQTGQGLDPIAEPLVEGQRLAADASVQKVLATLPGCGATDAAIGAATTECLDGALMVTAAGPVGLVVLEVRSKA